MKQTLALAGLIFSGIATSPLVASADDGDMTLRVPEPRLAVGAVYGRVGVDSGHHGTSIGIQGQLRLGQISLVGEIGKEELDDLSRTDRRVGASIQWRLTRGVVEPYIRAGGGIVRSEAFAGGLVYDDLFGEAGGGIAFRLSPRLSVTADAMFGKRDRLRWVSQDVILLSIYLPETTRYSRVSVGLVIGL
jgi:hypothetical protein